MDDYFSLTINEIFDMPGLFRKQKIIFESIYTRRTIYSMLVCLHRDGVASEYVTIDPIHILGREIGKIKGGNDQKILNKTIASIMSVVVDLLPDDNIKFDFTHIISDAKYDGKKIMLKISKRILPYLIDIPKQGNYTKMIYYCTFTLKSENALNLYIMLKSEEYKKTPIIFSIAKIRDRLGIDKSKLKTWVELRRYLIERCQIYFREQVDIIFEFTPIKTVRRETHVKFIIKNNIIFQKKIAMVKEVKVKKAEFEEKTKERHIEILKTMLFGRELEKAIEEYEKHPKHVIECVELTNKNKKVKNKNCYFLGCLKNGFQAHLEKDEKEKEDEILAKKREEIRVKKQQEHWNMLEMARK